MMKPKDSIDEIFAEFNASVADQEDTVHCEAFTLWIPSEYKRKYAMIQERSKRRFSKALKSIIMKSIDRVESEIEA